jgi:hypothetical protein
LRWQILTGPAGSTTSTRRAGAPAALVPRVLPPLAEAQRINVTRHAAALRPFRRDEFGTGAAAPTEDTSAP